MSDVRQKAEQRISDNYRVNPETLSCNVGLPGRLMLSIIPVVSIVLSALMVLYMMTFHWEVRENPGISVGIAIAAGTVIFILGLVGGKGWVFFGNATATATYMVYIDKDKTFFQKIFASLYRKFVENDAQVYLEARAKDPRLGNLVNLVKLIARISVSQVSFFIVSMSFLARPAVEYIRTVLPRDNPLTSTQTNVLITQNIAAVTMSVIIMGLYVPMSFLIEDSNIRTWIPKSRTVGTPSSTIRGKIDSMVGIGAIISGWSIYQSQIEESGMFLLEQFRGLVTIEGLDVALMVDYVIWLVFLMLLTWPLILPATYYYFIFYNRVVNKFRAEAYRKGVPIAITSPRLPDEEEKTIIDSFVSSTLGT